MWVEAILSKADLVSIVADICPLTIALGPDRDDNHYLKLLRPRDVSLVDDRGLRLTCEAEIRWPLLGVDVPIQVKSLTLMLSPTVTAAALGEDLTFTPELENVELSWVPGVFDGAMTEKINQELSKRHVELSWHFFKTLSHVFNLPDLLQPPTSLALRVAWGRVRVTEAAMVMAVSFHTRVLRGDDAGELLGETSASAPHEASSLARAPQGPAAEPRQLDGRKSVRIRGAAVPLAFAAVAAVIGLGAYVVYGLSVRRRYSFAGA